MSTTLTLQAVQSAATLYSQPTTTFNTETEYSSDALNNRAFYKMYVSFQPIPAAYQFQKVETIISYLYYRSLYSPAHTETVGSVDPISKSFDASTLNYQNAPGRIGGSSYSLYLYKTGYDSKSWVDAFNSFSKILRCGLMTDVSSWYAVQSSRSANPPYLEVSIGDEIIGLTISNAAPSNGSIVAANSNVFSWKEAASGTCYAEISRTSAKFRWRKSASDTVKEIDVPGTATSITIPANTFSGDSIQWQLSVTANSGVTTTSDWMTLSLTDVESTAVAVAPDRAVLDGSSDNVFKWEHVISTGTAQTKAELQQSTDGSTWTALATVTGAANTWTAPAGTFTSGTKYWRVRTYNSKGAAGAWSAATQFIVLAAPATPPVSIVSTEPRPEIRWQADEQQAYQVEIDGVYTSGTRFGTGKTWKAPFYLADGSYTVRVRVQNEYGFWSPWGTAALPVTNVPGGAITLTAEGGIEAALSWTPGSFDYYLVYRNGVAIAKVTEPSYTDAASIGVVRYQVRGCYDNSDNYSLSEAVEVTVGTDKVRLYDMERGEWLHFLYDSSAHRSTGLSLSQDIQYVQLSGHTYPVAERSEFKSRALRITCVCADDAERQSLRALLGHPTCCKTPEGNMTIGYPASITENSDDFFSTYSFTIEQIDRKEEINIDS
nr:MAG TPA: Oligo alginate lyase [Caudoviricetes sp.]